MRIQFLHPYAIDRDTRCALYEWIDGSKRSQHGVGDIEADLPRSAPPGLRTSELSGTSTGDGGGAAAARPPRRAPAQAHPSCRRHGNGTMPAGFF
jgi:hypothetical protein